MSDARGWSRPDPFLSRKMPMPIVKLPKKKKRVTLRKKSATPPRELAVLRDSYRPGLGTPSPRTGVLRFHRWQDDFRPWDLHDDGVDWSFLSTWMKCPRQCDLQYRQGWRSETMGLPIYFGTMFHKILEEVYANRADVRDVSDLIDEELAAVPARDAETGESAALLVEAVLPSYVAAWEDTADRWEHTELPIHLEYEYPPFSGPKLTCPAPVMLYGKIDGVVKDPDTGEVTIVDTKTTSDVDTEYLEDSLPLRFQTQLYALYWFIKHGTVPATQLNIVRRPGLRQRKTESNGDFAARVRADVEKRHEHYFQRISIRQTSAELAAWEAAELAPGAGMR